MRQFIAFFLVVYSCMLQAEEAALSAQLQKILRSDDTRAIRSALERITDQNLLERLALGSENRRVRSLAVNEITDQNRIYNIIKRSQDGELRYSATWRLVHLPYLVELVKNDGNPSVRWAATRNIWDQKVLVEIAQSNTEWFARFAAVQGIRDAQVLKTISIEDKQKEVREEANRVLGDVSKDKQEGYMIGPYPVLKILSGDKITIKKGDAERDIQLLYVNIGSAVGDLKDPPDCKRMVDRLLFMRSIYLWVPG